MAPRPKSPPTPEDTPARKDQRRPEPNVIDQRQQQIDPAGRHRTDVNASAGGSMKQPGRKADPEPDEE